MTEFMSWTQGDREIASRATHQIILDRIAESAEKLVLQQIRKGIKPEDCVILFMGKYEPFTPDQIRQSHPSEEGGYPFLLSRELVIRSLYDFAWDPQCTVAKMFKVGENGAAAPEPGERIYASVASQLESWKPEPHQFAIVILFRGSGSFFPVQIPAENLEWAKNATEEKIDRLVIRRDSLTGVIPGEGLTPEPTRGGQQRAELEGAKDSEEGMQIEGADAMIDSDLSTE